MIILDTNVISEGMRLSPAPTVMGWLSARSASELGTTTLSVAEIRYGLARLPFGGRRRDLEIRLSTLLNDLFADRVFGFDAAAAEQYGELAVARQRIGRPLQRFDGLIAAIAASRGFGVATRDVRGFDDCGLDVINPWEHGAA